MMTKDEERKALAKIRKIIEEAGRDSYIGIAFDGVCKIAEENIDNDWGCSPVEDCETYRERVEQLEKQKRELGQRIEEEKGFTEEEQARLKGEVEYFKDYSADLEAKRVAERQEMAEFINEAIALYRKMQVRQDTKGDGYASEYNRGRADALKEFGDTYIS